jgi:hypothetical protein
LHSSVSDRFSFEAWVIRTNDTAASKKYGSRPASNPECGGIHRADLLSAALAKSIESLKRSLTCFAKYTPITRRKFSAFTEDNLGAVP